MVLEMHRLRPVIGVFLLYAMTPGSGEILENTVHFVLAGHTAHAIADDAHQPDAPEHACSGPFHICACHASTPLTPVRATAVPGTPMPRGSEVVRRAEREPFEGYAGAVFRPPIG
jgi:hypothetical protein